MPKLDEAKERLGLLKFWLGIFVATFIAIGGWCATNYKIFPRYNSSFYFGCIRWDNFITAYKIHK